MVTAKVEKFLLVELEKKILAKSWKVVQPKKYFCKSK
jgi:hypothetical protein